MWDGRGKPQHDVTSHVRSTSGCIYKMKLGSIGPLSSANRALSWMSWRALLSALPVVEIGNGVLPTAWKGGLQLPSGGIAYHTIARLLWGCPGPGVPPPKYCSRGSPWSGALAAVTLAQVVYPAPIPGMIQLGGASFSLSHPFL